jgi:CRP/FNR family transcriptional regulator, cyclic AMP receptor protein
MAPAGRDVEALRYARRWDAHSQRDARPDSPPLYAYLLDADDDLAQELDVPTRIAARQAATARVLEAEEGDCDLHECMESVTHGPGLFLLDGLLAVETRVADRTVTELVGCGDLLQPPSTSADELIHPIASWRALRPSRLAMLDADFAARVRPWPQIIQELLRRVERRAEEAGLLRAISSQPRLEVRLVLLLWHLGARWGRVEPTGIRLTLPLTHRVLGQLVSAERPSITHALGRLANAGLVTGAPGDWHLHGDLDAHVESLIERAPPPHTRRRAHSPSAQGARR